MEVFDLKYQLSYLPQVMRLEYLEWADHPEENQEERIEKKIQLFYDHMSDEDYCKLVLLEKEELIGFISLFPRDGEEDLTPWYATMYVLEKYRGHGYSKLLHQALIEEARKRNITTLYLKTVLNHFYEKLGAQYLRDLKTGEKLYRLDLYDYETERLHIRPTYVTDVSLLLKTDHQEETQKFLGGLKDYSLEEREEFLKEIISSPDSYPYTVWLEDIPIGFVQIKKLQDDYGLSYLFDYDYWKKGYCTEAVKKILFESFPISWNRMVAMTFPENKNSIRVLEKAGFQVHSQNDEFMIYELIKH